MFLLVPSTPSPMDAAGVSWSVMPPVTAVLLHSVVGDRAGTAGGVFNSSRQTGGALAVAVFRTV